MFNTNYKMQAITTIGIVAIVLAALPSATAAYVVKTTPNGLDIRWNTTEINIVLDESLFTLGPQDDVENTVISAFDEWVDSAELPIEFNFRNGRCGEPGYRAGSENENCVMVSTDYLGNGDHVGARTVLSYAFDSGIIQDGDIVINGTKDMWKVGEQNGRYDLREAVLHEVGHLLGLAHSDMEEARMAPTMRPAAEVTSPKALFADDIAGVVDLYEGMDTPEILSCSVVHVGGSSSMGWFFGILVIGMLLRSRIRRINLQRVVGSKKLASLLH